MINNISEIKLVCNKVKHIYDSWQGSSAFNSLLCELNNLDIYLSGGVIRDTILNSAISPKDFDFILIGDDVDTFVKRLNKYGSMTFGQFNSPRWYPAGDESCYCDLMDIKRWNTGVESCTRAEDVLRQFDFTGNAIAINLRNFQLTNPIDGFNDLKNKQLNAIRFDFPDNPIRNDTKLTKMAIHWFRYLIYAQKLDLMIGKETKEWLQKNKKFMHQQDIYCQEFHENEENIISAISHSKIF